MTTNVFIHGVGQVDSSYLSDVQLLSSSDLVSNIDSNYPTKGVFFEIGKTALNDYYERHFVGLNPTDYDSENNAIGTSDAEATAQHRPIMFLKDLVTDTTDSVATSFKVVTDDNYSYPGSNSVSVSLTGNTKIETFATALKNDIERIFGSAFDVTSLETNVTHNAISTAVKESIEAQATGSIDAAIVADALRIENVEELQQLLDSSDASGYNFDSFADSGNRTASDLFLEGDIFKFKNGVKFEFSFKIPDYNPKEIYTSANSAGTTFDNYFEPSLTSATEWKLEEITEFGSYTEFKLTMWQDLFVVVQDT